jgi:predicted RNA methylase
MAAKSTNAIDRVSVAPFQRRFLELERAGLTSRTEIAKRLGWVRRPPASMRARGCVDLIPDTGRVSRVLGLKAVEPQKSVGYEVDVRLCEVLQLDPVDCGV